MSVFNPQLITDPRLRTTGTGEVIPAPEPTTPPPPVFIPQPIPIPIPPKKKTMISAETAKRAQGIYPREAQEKQNLIDNAKTPPTPTGAWGAPQ